LERHYDRHYDDRNSFIIQATGVIRMTIDNKMDEKLTKSFKYYPKFEDNHMNKITHPVFSNLNFERLKNIFLLMFF
jgi:hypothetical protein